MTESSLLNLSLFGDKRNVQRNYNAYDKQRRLSNLNTLHNSESRLGD